MRKHILILWQVTHCSEILGLTHTERKEGSEGKCPRSQDHCVWVTIITYQLDTNGSLRIGRRCSGSNLMKIGEDCEHLEQHKSVQEHTAGITEADIGGPTTESPR